MFYKAVQDNSLQANYILTHKWLIVGHNSSKNHKPDDQNVFVSLPVPAPSCLLLLISLISLTCALWFPFPSISLLTAAVCVCVGWGGGGGIHMYSYFVSELDSGLQRPQPTVFCGYAAVSHEFIKELFFLHFDVVQCHHVVLYGKGCFCLQLLVVRHTLLFSLSKKAIFQIAISFFSLVHPLVEVRTPAGCTHHTLVIPTLRRSLKKHTGKTREREHNRGQHCCR